MSKNKKIEKFNFGENLNLEHNFSHSNGSITIERKYALQRLLKETK